MAQTGPKEVAEMVGRKFIDTLGARGATIIILDSQTNASLVELHLGSGFVSREEDRTYWRLRSRQLSRTDGSVLYCEPEQSPESKHEGGEELRKIIDLPLRFQDGMIGFIRLYLDRPFDLTEEERNTLKIMVHQGGCAIEKSRLIQRQQSDYEHLAATTEKMSALGRLSAGVAHEINNPLAGILLFSTNLLKKVDPESDLGEGLGVIIQEVMRCKNIIQELLDFSREREPTWIRYSLNKIITRAMTIIENEYRLRRIALEKNLAKDLPESTLDPSQMEQVVVNLMLNAAQAIGEGGWVRIESRLSQGGDRVEMLVSDSGCGIEPQDLSKVFDPFYSTKPQGTGLGLAVTYGIVRNHQGNIRVASTPGKGTTFTVDLPLTVPDDAEG